MALLIFVMMKIIECTEVVKTQEDQRWEFIKENKKVRKHALDQETNQETIKK